MVMSNFGEHTNHMAALNLITYLICFFKGVPIKLPLVENTVIQETLPHTLYMHVVSMHIQYNKLHC